MCSPKYASIHKARASPLRGNVVNLSVNHLDPISVGRGLAPAAQNHVAFWPHFGEFVIPGDGGGKPPPYS